MGISDSIACFIQDVLESENGCAELQRAQLAQRFGCVPSQINYVITTRFSPEHGYIVESRRGGGGFIRIRRVQCDTKTMVMHALNAVEDEIGAPCARAFLQNLLDAGVIDQKTARLMSAAMGDQALKCVPAPCRDTARAQIFKQMLLSTIGE